MVGGKFCGGKAAVDLQFCRHIFPLLSKSPYSSSSTDTEEYAYIFYTRKIQVLYLYTHEIDTSARNEVHRPFQENILRLSR